MASDVGATLTVLKSEQIEDQGRSVDPKDESRPRSAAVFAAPQLLLPMISIVSQLWTFPPKCRLRRAIGLFSDLRTLCRSTVGDGGSIGSRPVSTSATQALEPQQKIPMTFTEHRVGQAHKFGLNH
jgi:hypothetical protein